MKTLRKYVLAVILFTLALHPAWLRVSGADFVSETKLLAFDGAADDEFGFNVAIDGNTAVVGAHRADAGAIQDQGSVYVFTGSGTDWNLQQKLTPSDGTNQNDFGSSVAIQGDTIFVGAPARTIGFNAQQGKVYVFKRNGAVWTEQQSLIAGDGGNLDRFGDSVALDGDYAIIGASEDTLKGSAYIFSNAGGNWTQQQKIAPADGNDSDDFGLNVSISGNTVVIGAPGANGAGVREGAAYVYVRDGSSWSMQSKLVNSDAAGFQYFGFDVAISEDTVLVSKRGSAPVYVFVRNGTTWTEQQKLTPLDQSGRALFSVFRTSVAINRETAAIGWAGDIGKISDQGAVFTFERTGTVWTQSQSLIATDGLVRDYLGFSVALSDKAVISGAILDDEETRNSQGSAYIFYQAIPDIDLTISLNRITDQLLLEWNTQPGRTYSIEGSNDLNGFPINVLDPFNATADKATHSLAVPGEPRVFYRVRETN